MNLPNTNSENNEHNSDIKPRLKNGNKSHFLTVEDKKKGGSVCSDKKKMSAKLRVYNNPDLNCGSCKNKCNLYDPSRTDCQKGIILRKIRDIGQSPDPLKAYEFLFDNLAHMALDLGRDISNLDLDGKVTFQKRKIVSDLIMDYIKIRFGDSLQQIKEKPKLSPSDVLQAIRDAEKNLKEKK